MTDFIDPAEDTTQHQMPVAQPKVSGGFVDPGPVEASPTKKQSFVDPHSSNSPTEFVDPGEVKPAKEVYASPSPDPSVWDRVKGAYITTTDLPHLFANWISDKVEAKAIDPSTGQPQGQDMARTLRKQDQSREDQKYSYSVPSGIPEFIGGATKILTDPVSVVTLPIGGEGELLNFARMAKLSGLGAAYGAGTEALQELQDTGKISDPSEVFKRGLEGAVMLPTGDVILRSAGKLIKLTADNTGISDKLGDFVDGINNMVDNIKSKVYAPKVLQGFNDRLDLLQDHIVEQVANGNQGANAILDAELRMGQHPEDTMMMLEATGRKLTMPNSQEEAVKLLRTSDLGRDDPMWKNNFINDLVTPLSTSIREIEPRVFNDLRRMEFAKRSNFHEAINTVEPFLQKVDGLSKPLQNVVNDALRNGDFETVRDVFRAKGDGEALKAFDAATGHFDKQWKDLQSVYPDLKREQNFWPRVIKDKDALFKALGTNQKSLLDNALQKLQNKLGRKPDAWMEAQLVTNLLKDGRPRMFAPGTIKNRKFTVVPDEYKKFYADARTSAHMYFNRTTDDVAKRQFFDKSIKYLSKDKKIVDYNETIGHYINTNTKLRESNDAFHELKRLLRLRFVEGEQRPHKVIRAMKDLTYGGTLSNLWSDLTQFKDFGNVLSRYGFMNTVKSVIGKQRWKAADLALTDISAELEHSPSATARYVEKSLRYSGFQKADIFGKTLAMNAAWRKYVKMAQTEQGSKFIFNKYAKSMGQDVFPMINDLKHGNKTDLSGFFIFHELSDMQPLSLSEMTPGWLSSPNWRIAYALKSFTLKQMDMVLNDTMREIQKGNTYQGMKMMLRYAVYLSAAGMSVDMIKDKLKGHDISTSDVPSYVADNLLQIFGGSKFMADQLANNKMKDALMSIYSPAFVDMASTVYKDIYKNIMKNDTLRPPNSKLDPDQTYFDSAKYLGVPGSFWYWWAGPGKDKVDKSNAQKNPF